MNATINKKKVGKSLLSLVLVMLMLFSAIPFTASAANGGSTTGNTASPYPLPNQKDPAHDYPSAGDEGYVQLTKSAAWSTDGTNLDPQKKNGYITMNTYGTPVGGGAVDVILVADISWSMGPANGGSQNYALLRSTATEFVNKIFADQVGVKNDNRVGIVLLGTANKDYWNDTDRGFSLFRGANEKGTVLAQIQKFPEQTNEGTSFENPLLNAQRMINEDPRKNEKRTTYVIFMTDGNPNYNSSNPSTWENFYGVQAATNLKNNNPNLTIIGVGMGTAATMSNIDPLCSANPDDPSKPWSYKGATTAEFQGAYDIIAGKLTQAATDVTITDYINTEHFEVDTSSSRPFILDGNAITLGSNGVHFDQSQQKITWNLDVITSNGNELKIPVKFKTNEEGVFYTNKDKGDNSKVADRAMIEYTNYQGNPSRKAVESPALARPYAGIQVIYYEVDASGNPVDDSGSSATITDRASFEARYHSLGGYTRSQMRDTTENYQAAGTIKDANGNFYKLHKGAKYASNASDNIDVTPASNDASIQVWFGYEKVNGANVNLTKTYNPPLPQGVEASEFVFINVDDGSTIPWTAVTSGTVVLAPDVEYRVTEKAAPGYKRIPDFNLKFDGTNLICTDAAGLPAGVTMKDFNLAFVNEKDSTQTKDVSYKVRYYTTDNQKEEFETVNATVWVNETTIPVNASDIDLTNRYAGYKCDIVAANLPATVPATNGQVDVPHSPDNNATKKASYYVEYYRDGGLTKKETVTKDIWINATDITVDTGSINKVDYYGVGYAFDKTDPVVVPSEIGINGTIKVYYITDTGATKNITYTVDYYLDGEWYKKETYTETIWAGTNTKKITENDLEQFPGYVFKKATPALPYDVADKEVIRADYISDPSIVEPITYTVAYEDEGGTALATTETKTKYVWSGSPYGTFTVSEVKNISKYVMKEVKVNGAVVALPYKSIEDGDEIVVVYKPDPNAKEDITFTIAYYKDGSTSPDFTEPKTVSVKVGQKYNLTQSEVDTNKFAGEKINPAKTTFPIAVGNGETAEIYFMTDSSQLKTISYKIEHYVDGVLQEDDTINVTETGIPVTESTVDVTDTSQTYPGYKRVTGALIGKAQNGDVFRVDYTKDLTDIKTVSYTVSRFTNEWDKMDQPATSYDSMTVTVDVWSGATMIDVRSSDWGTFQNYTDSFTVTGPPKKTFVFNSIATTIPTQVPVGGDVELYYVEKSDVAININAKVSYPSGRLAAGQFEFEMVDVQGNQVGKGYNNANGTISMTLTLPLDVASLNKTETYTVRYWENSKGGSGSVIPKKPDLTEYRVQAQIVLNSKGIPTLNVLSYEKAINFIMR